MASLDYRPLFEDNPNAIVVFDRHTRELYAVNDAACRHFGYTRGELLGRDIATLRPPEDREPMLHAYDESVARSTPGPMPFPGVWRHQRKDGSIAFVELWRVRVDFEGQAASLVVIWDVSQRIAADHAIKEAREASARSEERFRALIENSVDGIGVLDPAGRMVFMSASAERNLGWAGPELAGVSMLELVHPEDVDTAAKGLAQTLSAPRARASVTVRVKDAAGHWRWMEGSATNLLDVPAVGGIVVNFRDVTARRQLEEQLRQAQKMEATGLLAGGIAHDFNNLLGVVLGATELARRAARQGRPVDAMLAEVEEAAKRAAELTRNLLAFSRKQVLHVKPIDLGEAVEDFLGLLRRIIGEDVDLEVLRCPERLVVKADVSQLEQVLLNLSTNARQAMPSGGCFSIRLARARFDDAYVTDHPWAAPGDYAELTVADTGVGMDADTQARAAEPFFTTKASGTGLGLAMVHGIVHQHGGLLRVQSEVGKGTRVSVYFPLVQADVAEAAAPPPPARSWAPRGHETLLVAEDEPTLRKMLASTLGDLGYRVMVAADGDEAARVLASSQADISLAILDVVMPKLGGVEAYARMRALSPGLKVIFTTGHAPDGDAVSDIVARGHHALLHKPFRLDDLGKLVRQTLDAHA